MIARQTRHSTRGFTLTELAIVLVIVALLIGGMLVPLSAQQDIHNSSETQKHLNEIKEALLGFALVHGRLPCPANPATASGTAGAGEEYTSSAAGCTTSLEGVVPWATLGVSETDAWGRRITYRVTADFAKTAPFTLASTGSIKVLVSSGGATIAENLPAAFISHGKNGLGAYLPSGSQIGPSANASELENTDADTSYVSASGGIGYDDLTGWLAPGILMNRMVAADRLP